MKNRFILSKIMPNSGRLGATFENWQPILPAAAARLFRLWLWYSIGLKASTSTSQFSVKRQDVITSEAILTEKEISNRKSNIIFGIKGLLFSSFPFCKDSSHDFPYSLISIRQNYNFDMLAMIWHEIVCWFLKIYQDLKTFAA